MFEDAIEIENNLWACGIISSQEEKKESPRSIHKDFHEVELEACDQQLEKGKQLIYEPKGVKYQRKSLNKEILYRKL